MHRSTAGLSDSTSKLHARASGESAVIPTQRTLISFVNVTGLCGRTDGVAYDSDDTGYPSRTGSVSSEAVSSCICICRLKATLSDRPVLKNGKRLQI